MYFGNFIQHFTVSFLSFLFRKRSRDEDTCDFMPISKRINNLTLTSQSLGEHEPSSIGHNSNGSAAATSNHHFMAINNQEIQSQHFAQHSLVNSYPNGMSHHYLNQHGQPAHNPNYHQSHNIVQSTNHSNGFHNNSHLAIGTNTHKHNHNHQSQHQPPSQQQQHQQQHQLHHQNHDEPNNNEMEEVYSPELTPDENPFYYDKNKLLFDLHVERERRHQSHWLRCRCDAISYLIPFIVLRK